MVIAKIAEFTGRSPEHRLLADGIGLVVLLVACFFLWNTNAKSTNAAFDGRQAHDYLCYVKTVVLPKRIASTVKYEQDVQLGFRKPITGITVADLASSIKRDQDTLRALVRVKC